MRSGIVSAPMTLPPRCQPTPCATTLGNGPASAAELREQFTQFVGEAFYGQMLKAMRATVGKPAYFHGGRAEEVFQGQLDQHMAEHLTEATRGASLPSRCLSGSFRIWRRRTTPTNLNQLDTSFDGC